MPNLILVVEDEPTLQFVARKALKMLGHSCLIAGTGEEAVELNFGNIKLIFMDVGVPGIDGVQATVLIREKELQWQRKCTPIIALTGHANKNECLQAGMDDYLQKTALMADLRRMINNWCPSRLDGEHAT